MAQRRSDSTFWIGVGALTVARAFHWFITPMRHPHPSAWALVGVALQVGFGIAGIVYGVVLRRRGDDDDDLDVPNPEGGPTASWPTAALNPGHLGLVQEVKPPEKPGIERK